jgi:hypothetical protein
MRIPKKDSIGFAILKYLRTSKKKALPPAELVTRMVNLGFTSDGAQVAIARLIEGESVYRREDGAIGLTQAAREHMNNVSTKDALEARTPEVPPIDTFKPLSQKYINAMREARRPNDGRKPMTFIPMATNWN